MARLEVASEVTGKIWKIEVQVGAEVAEDSVLMIVESMKMEIPIVCEEAGVVAELFIGTQVSFRQSPASGPYSMGIQSYLLSPSART
jgi:acetyl-CoA carboxylase biotin carboxyl carrier protein